MKRSTIILFIFIAILFILPFATIKIWMATHPEEINSMGSVSGNKDTINQVIQIEAEEIPENFEGPSRNYYLEPDRTNPVRKFALLRNIPARRYSAINATHT